MRDHDEDEYWRRRLSPQQFAVCRRAATEPPFSGRWYAHWADGVYRCVACANPLFDASCKYDSGSGWPSWYAAIDGALSLRLDQSHGMQRVEVRCSGCGSHLGHLFEDGPPPTGLRYCINSLALDFVARAT